MNGIGRIDAEQCGHLFRDHAGQVVASLVRVLNNFDAAEDAFQEACASAVVAWPRDGVPSKPGAWLLTVARRKALDMIRRDSKRDTKQQAALVLLQDDRSIGPLDHIDDRLRLMFTCCHPALAMEARVALTLRTLGGLTTNEIARAFLVQEVTMAQRLVRARHRIRAAGIPYKVPAPDELAERLDGVLQVVYLIFNEGYSASQGADLVRAELCVEAIRLGRLMADLLPDEAEASGLLALMLLHDARRTTRVDEHGDLVLLRDQDRARWDHAQIVEGLGLLHRTLRMGMIGPYQLQAAIAALHAEASSFERTDWRQIALLYRSLAGLTPSPIIELNRGVAIAMADGPAVGLGVIDRWVGDPVLASHQLFHSSRAELLRQLERFDEARSAYETALTFATTEPARRFLQRRIAQIGLRIEPATFGSSSDMRGVQRRE